MQGALAAQGSHPCASLLLRNTGKWLVDAEEEHPGAPTGVLGQDAWGEGTGQRSKEHPECPLRPHAGGRLASHAAGAGNGAHPSRRARCLPHWARPKRSGLGGPRCGVGGGAAFRSLCSQVLGAPWARAAGFTHCLRRSGKRGTWAIRSRLEVGDWILAKRPLKATGRGGRHLRDPPGCGLRALCGPTAPQQEVCTGQRPRPPLGPHSDTLGTWGPEAVGRGQALTGGPPQCQPPTRGDLNATSPPNTRPPTRRATLLQATPGGVTSRGQRGRPRLTLQACPSSRAALWASAGFSITLPVCPEKSMATREFSDTLRWKDRATSV